MATLRRLASWEQLYSLKGEFEKSRHSPKLDEPLITGLIEILKLQLNEEAMYNSLKFVVGIISKGTSKMVSIVDWFNSAEPLTNLMEVIFTTISRLLYSHSQSPSFRTFIIYTCDLLFDIGTKCDEIHNSMVLKISNPFFSILNADNLLYLTKKEALLKFKPFLVKANIHSKKQMIKLHWEIFEFLASWLCSCGDYDLQDAILEVITRYSYLSKHKLDLLKVWFQKHKEAANAVDLLDYKSYDLTSRLFLNAVNRSISAKLKVFSPPCLEAYGNETKLVKPQVEGYTDFWVDFSGGSGVIHMNCDAGKGTWNEITLLPHKIKSIKAESHTTCNGEGRLSLKIVLTDEEYVQMPSGKTENVNVFTFLFLETSQMKRVRTHFFKKHFPLIFKEVKMPKKLLPFPSPASLTMSSISSISGPLRSIQSKDVTPERQNCQRKRKPSHTSTPTKSTRPPMFNLWKPAPSPLPENQGNKPQIHEDTFRASRVESFLRNTNTSIEIDKRFSEAVKTTMSIRDKIILTEEAWVKPPQEDKGGRNETENTPRAHSSVGIAKGFTESQPHNTLFPSTCSKPNIEPSVMPPSEPQVSTSHLQSDPVFKVPTIKFYKNKKQSSIYQTTSAITKGDDAFMFNADNQLSFSKIHASAPLSPKPKKRRKLFNLKSWNMNQELNQSLLDKGDNVDPEGLFCSPLPGSEVQTTKRRQNKRKVRFDIPKPKPAKARSKSKKKEGDKDSEGSQLPQDQPGVRRSSRLRAKSSTMFFKGTLEESILSPPAFTKMVESERNVDPVRETREVEEEMAAICPSPPLPQPTSPYAPRLEGIEPTLLPPSPQLPVPSPPPSPPSVPACFPEDLPNSKGPEPADKSFVTLIRDFLANHEKETMQSLLASEECIARLRSTFNDFMDGRESAAIQIRNKINLMKEALDSFEVFCKVDFVKQQEIKKEVGKIVEDFKKRKEYDLRRIQERKDILRSKMAKWKSVPSAPKNTQVAAFFDRHHL